MVYTISILWAHAEYARGTPDGRCSYAGISRDFCAYENYFINQSYASHTFAHTQYSVTGPFKYRAFIGEWEFIRTIRLFV
jgi:hypothetical protein